MSTEVQRGFASCCIAELFTFRTDLEKELRELVGHHRARLREAVARLLEEE